MATIKTQLEASGVSKFQQQMRQASGAVKAMGAELKVAEAAYQQTGDQAAFLAEKSSILKQQLEEQKKAVSAAEKALEQVKKQYGENSTQANAWRTKLAQARTTLIQTETAIKNTDAAMDALGRDDVSGVADGLAQVDEKAKGAKKSADELGDSVGSIDQKLDVQAITGAIDKITGGFDRVIQKAAQMGKAIWDASLDAANWADATRDAATAAHMSTTEYQQLGYAAQFFGTSVEDLTKSQGRMSKAMASADDEVIEVGDSLVNTMAWVEDGMGGYIRKKRSWSDVLLDTLDALGGIEDASERDAVAMELFGKSYADLNGIIAGGTDAFRKRMNEAPVVSEETVDNLANTADAIKDMDSKLQVLKMELLNALAPSIETIAKAVGSLAEQLTKFVQSKEGQELLAKLGESIQTIVTNLAGNDFEKTVEAAKNVLTDLNKAFEWISQNYVGVAIAIGTITAAVGALKVASAGLTLATGLNSLQQLLAGKGGTPVPTGAPTTAPVTGPTVVGGGSGFGAAFLRGTGIGAAYVAPVVGALGLESLFNRIHLGAIQDIDFQKLADAAEAAGEVLPFTEADVNALKASQQSGWFDWQTRLDTKMGAKEFVATNWADMRQYTADFQFWQDFARELGMTYDEFMAMTPDSAEFARADQKIKAWTKWDARYGWDEQADGAEAWGDSLGSFETQAQSAMAMYIDAYSQMYEDAEKSLDSAAPAVEGAASGLVAAAVSMLNGATAALSTGVGSFSSGNYSAISNLYIGSYNQNGGGDVNALASAMAAAQTRLRQGFGARK